MYTYILNEIDDNTTVDFFKLTAFQSANVSMRYWTKVWRYFTIFYKTALKELMLKHMNLYVSHFEEVFSIDKGSQTQINMWATI